MITGKPIVKLVTGILVSCTFLVGSCSDKKLESTEKAINTRLLKRPFSIATVRLKTPPLLSIPLEKRADAQIALQKEQQVFLSQLRNLSSDIEILNRYQFVFNGVAVKIPQNLMDRFSDVIKAGDIVGFPEIIFARPAPIQINEVTAEENLEPSWGSVSSIDFMGVKALRSNYKVYGKGMKVGVIDTGVDYTHKMFGGLGLSEDFKNNDPSIIEQDSFPTLKVVGGYDFVGTAYDSGSDNYELRLPKPDNDPIDESGHGSHVAGTIAGQGYGVIAYPGAAPEADIYALKVFGKDGSTSDHIVIAALEYAANPNSDLDYSDHLDVVNLSLGSSYGTTDIPYNEAVTNLTKGGTLVVISAGNSGDTPYIVGSPSISDDAISVAASIDSMTHNISFPAVEFQIKDDPAVIKKIKLVDG